MQDVDLLERAKRASDEDLFRGLEVLTTSEHAVVLKVLVLLGEIDERRAYAKRAYPSMFELCVSNLNYSEGQACRRIKAARAIRKYPALFERFAAREITLTNLATIQKHLTPDNHEELAKAVGKNRTREVERIVATWFPEVEKKPVIRKLPDAQQQRTQPPTRPTPPTPPTPLTPTSQSSQKTTPQMQTLRLQPQTQTPMRVTTPTPAPNPRPAPPPAEVKAVSESRYRAHFTMSTETYERLERIKSRTKGCVEAADLDRLMAQAIRLLEDDVNRRVRAEVKKESREMTEEIADKISRPTKRNVFRRDESQCTFRDDESGRRCSAREFLELDHIVPKAKGGDSSESNLRVRCRAHNRLAAEAEFGRDYIAKKIDAHRQRSRLPF